MSLAEKEALKLSVIDLDAADGALVTRAIEDVVGLLRTSEREAMWSSRSLVLKRRDLRVLVLNQMGHLWINCSSKD